MTAEVGLKNYYINSWKENIYFAVGQDARNFYVCKITPLNTDKYRSSNKL